MHDYELIPFRLDDSRTVALWLDDAGYTARVTGETAFPFGAEDVMVWSYEASRAYLLTDSEIPVAYGEIIEDDADGDVELAHIVVAPEKRAGETYRIIVEMLVNATREAYRYPEVWLRIGRGGEGELDAAVTLGFVEAPEVSGEKFIWLRKSL